MKILATKCELARFCLPNASISSVNCSISEAGATVPDNLPGYSGLASRTKTLYA